MSRRGFSVEFERGSRLRQAALVLLVGVAVAALWVLAFKHTYAAPTMSGSRYTPPQHRESAVVAQSVPVSSAIDGLSDKGDPLVILALGDSTTASSPTNWLNVVAQDLASEYGRPAVIHPWAQGLTPPRYASDIRYPAGSGAPIEVWSAGASGQNADYTLAHLDEMAPMPPRDVDWVIINHGHNHGPGEVSVQVGDLMDEVMERWPQAPVTAIRQNPETVRARVAMQRANLADLDGLAAARGIGVVDVYSAFKKDPQPLSKLIDSTGIHPTPAGYRVWADVVEAWVDNHAAG